MWLRKTLISLLLVTLLAGLPVVSAQEGASAMYDLNMRTGPGADYDLVTVLSGGTPIVLEARNGDVAWVLVHTADGTYRGWVAALYVVYPPGMTAAALPPSSEVVSGAPAPAPEQPPADNPAPAAPGDVTALTTYDLNVRGGPGTNHAVVGHLPGGTGLVLEARSGDSSWVLAHTADNSVRGWLASLYVRFTGVTASSLPVSSEVVSAPASPQASSAVDDTDNPLLMHNYPGLNLARVQSIDLNAYPAIGRATGTARSIFVRGRAAGRDPRYFSKIGDCFTEHEYFLKHFTWDKYELGEYSNLQPVIDNFKEAYDDLSYGASTGFLAGAVLDRMWAAPGVCDPTESPLECEYRVHNPSAAVIMFGTQDMLLMTPEEFDFYMREVVRFTISDNVIPILSTFPGNTGQWDKTVLYNQIVVTIAQDYDVPLMNFWLALEDLPNHGLDDTGNHLSMPITGPGDMSYPNLDQGYPMRNLVVLQTLDSVWRGAMQ